MYVTDSIQGHVLKFTPEGKHLATIGSKGEEPHQFALPFGICIDSNDIIYVTDTKKHQVMVFTTEGEYLGCVGDFPELRKIAVDKTGIVYVCVWSGEVLVSKQPQ